MWVSSTPFAASVESPARFNIAHESIAHENHSDDSYLRGIDLGRGSQFRRAIDRQNPPASAARRQEAERRFLFGG